MPMRHPATSVLSLFAAACACFAASSASAQSTQPQEAQPQAPAPQGLLPIPNYEGDLLERAYLSGDWFGIRSDLAEKGVQLDIDWTQFLQSVVDGGVNEDTEYGGSLDYTLSFDLMRMGVMQGALVKIRAESRYGDSVNGDAGSILPVNTASLFPVTDSLDDDLAFAITTLSYTQFLSEKFAVMLGKFDTLDGDPNEFASGRGTMQFMDANFVFNSVMALRLPYSTLGGGVVWMPSRRITVTSMAFNTIDSSTTSGFSDVGDGATWTTEANLQYRLGELPGGMNVGFLYSFDQDFARIGGRFIFQPGQGIAANDENDTWAAYWSGWQYLFVSDDGQSDAPVILANGIPDRQGFGVFARAGIADQDTNPVEWSASVGVGGRGVFGRKNDVYGVGYYYAALQSTLLSEAVGISDHVQGFEAFYNIAITPAARLTLNAQVVDSPVSAVDTALILGMRLRLVF